MQLTNIARDVVEDNIKNRTYIESNFESIEITVDSLEETDFEREKISAASFQSRGIDLKNIYSRNGLIAVLVQ